jgi:hypothetical protein
MIEKCANLHFPIFTLTILTMSTKEDKNGKESKESDYGEDKEQLEEEQEEEIGDKKEQTTFFNIRLSLHDNGYSYTYVLSDELNTWSTFVMWICFFFALLMLISLTVNGLQ